MKKKKIVENDKQKIEEVIKELDEKKNEALKIASTKVNKVCFSLFFLFFCFVFYFLSFIYKYGKRGVYSHEKKFLYGQKNAKFLANCGLVRFGTHFAEKTPLPAVQT